MIKTTSQIREHAKNGRFVDVQYHDLLTDPLRQLQRIYSTAGMNFGETAQSDSLGIVRSQPQFQFGRHVYTLESFGLTQEKVERDFTEYRKRYSIPVE